ncbi:MAG: PKD domain-containing protein [Thermoplasmatota archaeon]
MSRSGAVVAVCALVLFGFYPTGDALEQGSSLSIVIYGQEVAAGGTTQVNVMVKDPSGRHIAGAVVTVGADEGTFDFYTGTTPAFGYLAFNYRAPEFVAQTHVTRVHATASYGGPPDLSHSVNITLLAGGSTGGLSVVVSSDRPSLASWTSCNLTAVVTDRGRPLPGVPVDWNASKGWLVASSTATDENGRARVIYTAMGDGPELWSGVVNVTATARNGTESARNWTTINVGPLGPAWSVEVSARHSAGQLYPGEALMVEASLRMPPGQGWEFIYPLRVEAYMSDMTGHPVAETTLGENISLTGELNWSSGPRALFRVPASPTVARYQWTVWVVSGNGLYAYYKMQEPRLVDIYAERPEGWTIMVYLSGDSNLAGEAGVFFNNLARVNPGNGISVLVQWDGPRDGVRSTRRYQLGTYGMTLLETLEDQNSGSPEVFRQFLDWASAAAPAQHYCVVIWDHGGAYVGSSYDYPARAHLSNVDVAGSLESFMQEKRKVEVLVFNTCLMSCIEVVERFRGVTDFVAGSETPINRDFFQPECLELIRDHSAGSVPSARQVARDFVDGYMRSGMPEFPFTVLDMSRGDELLGALSAVGEAALDKRDLVFPLLYDLGWRYPCVEGPYLNSYWLVDANSLFKQLELMINNASGNYLMLGVADRIESYLEVLNRTIDHRMVTKNPLLCGVNLFSPFCHGVYLKEREEYLRVGIPASNGWIRMLDAYHGYRPTYGQVGNQYLDSGIVRDPIAGVVSSTSDQDGDGELDAIGVDIVVDQTPNTADVSVLVDMIAYNGTRGGEGGELLRRSVLSAGGGSHASHHLNLTSPVSDFVDVIVTVQTGLGWPVQQIHVASEVMGAAPREGSAPSLSLSASKNEALEGETILFTASASDPDGGDVSLWWDFDDSNGVGLDATGPSVSTYYRWAGNRTVTCVASDGANLAVGRVGVIVRTNASNRAPTASLSHAIPDPRLPLRVHFNATLSADPDGLPLDYAISFGDGNQTLWGRGGTWEHDYGAKGVYRCILRVMDICGAWSSAVLEVNLTGQGPSPANRPPVAVLSVLTRSPTDKKPVVADASGSSDPDNDTLMFRFDWGDGNVTDWSVSAIASHTYARAGRYNVTLHVRDSGNLTASESRDVTVRQYPVEPKSFINGPSALLAIVASLVALFASLRRRTVRAP